MTIENALSADVRSSLTRLAESSDRASPTVFAGRDREFGLLASAARGAQQGEAGHTVVIQGVPGAGKTALLNEYAARSLAADCGAEKSIIPVPLRPSDIDAPPVAIVQEIDRQFREFGASDGWGRAVNQMVGGATLLGNALFAAFAKRDFNDFRPSARAPNSLPVALDDYVAFRFDRREGTIVLLVDEAQNLSDTIQVRAHLDALHGGIAGRARVMLACFGLEGTMDRLRELGLSRLATGHVRSIGALSDADAKRTVTGTLNVALADCVFQDDPFDAVRRAAWIGAAAATILAESANFPHHLANGCRALAEIVLDKGIDHDPPVERLRDTCRIFRREYYDARLRPWMHHMTALSHAFAQGAGSWTPVAELKRVLMASDDFGNPVDADTATAVLKELHANGYVVHHAGAYRPALPSLSSHFESIRRDLQPQNEVVRSVQTALAS